MSFRGKCYRGKDLGENVTRGKTLQGKMLQGKMFQGKTAFPLVGHKGEYFDTFPRCLFFRQNIY